MCHGLYSHLTCRVPEKNDGKEVFWLEDFLQEYIPSSRIIPFSFNDDLSAAKLLSWEGVHSTAVDFLERMWNDTWDGTVCDLLELGVEYH